MYQGIQVKKIWFGVLPFLYAILELVFCGAETTYFCRNKAETVIYNNSGIIRTVEEGKQHYDNNMDCVWVVEPSGDDVRIQLTIVSSDLQWAPSNAICNGYDYIEVRDEGNMDGPVILSWCGETNPRSIISNTSKLFIRFKSNDRNIYTYAGAKIKFETFTMGASGGCPVGWKRGPDPGGAYCYNLNSYSRTWKEGQDFCMYQQSNLVSFASDTESEFVAEYVQSEMGTKNKDLVWIGLNDIEVDADYEWIDHISSTATMRWHDIPHVSNEYLNCVAMKASNGLWEEESCAESDVQSLVQYRFICKRRSDGPTALYLVPTERIQKGEEGNLPPKAAIIIGVIVGCGLLGGTVFGIFYYFHKKKTISSSGSPVRSRAQPERVTSPEAVQLETQRQDYPASPDLPPSYDEALSTQFSKQPPSY